MSAPINDGGPAFPCDHLVDDDGVSLASGMSLRDYFAAHALNGLIAHVVGVKNGDTDDYARRAYKYADAMLEARTK